MAARVTYADVMGILDSDCDVPANKIENVIVGAHVIVERVFKGDTSVTEELLTEIERWLSAHMVTVALYRMAAKERVGDAEVTYTGQWGQLLHSTPFGQMVLTLDATGKLAKTGKSMSTLFAIPNFSD